MDQQIIEIPRHKKCVQLFAINPKVNQNLIVAKIKK